MENKSRVAGILSIVSGAFGFIQFGSMALFGYFFRVMTDFAPRGYGSAPPDHFFNFMLIYFLGIGSLFAIMGVLAIVGGVFALKKRLWGLALAGAIAGTITFYPVGIVAVIFTSLSSREFVSTSGASDPGVQAGGPPQGTSAQGQGA